MLVIELICISSTLSVYNTLIAILLRDYNAASRILSWPLSVDYLVCLILKISVVYILNDIGFIMYYFFSHVSTSTQQTSLSSEITHLHGLLFDRLIDRGSVLMNFCVVCSDRL